LEVAKSLEIKENRFGLEPEMTAKMAAMRVRIFEVPISYNGRTYEEGKKITWKDGFSAIRCILKYNSTIEKNNQTVLITAGPTYEAIDPVRFIGNHSSGKMGFALAESCLKRGMNVILVSGPTQLELHHPNLQVISVKSAEQMLKAVSSKWAECTIGIFAAAVADYRPVNQELQKIKKKEETLTLELVKNPDILRWASENRNNAQKVIGFALETNNAEENALLKLKSKNLDMIVLNTLENKGAGFTSRQNSQALRQVG
jgi:phosphopantothenoylcysteine decarboxylase/phosphopantothenate--cysteine ligase